MTLLSLERVSKSFRRGRREVQVFDGVSFLVDRGDHVAVRGRRRSGKSTLLRLCAGMEDPDSGTILFDGRDLGAMGRKQRSILLRKEVGYVGSSFEQERGTMITRPKRVVDFVGLPLVGDGWSAVEAQGPAREMLQRVGASECLDAYMAELSPGEHTLVGLARALVREPRLVLVDEPEGCPSPDERATIRELLKELGRQADLALVIASESPGVLKGARRVYALDGHGRLLADSEDDPGAVVPFRRGNAASGES